MNTKKIFLSILFSCLLVLVISCNEATPEQIKETELATKKEKMLEEMHEDEVKELLKILAEKAKDGEFYYFVNLGKNAEKYKDNPYFNIFNEEKGYALQILTDKVKEIPEYKKLLELHKKYHKVLWEGDYDNMSEEECNDHETITYDELRKWNIVDNKIKSQKNIGKYKLIENTVCPICRCIIDDSNAEEHCEHNYFDYIFGYDNRPYFDKYKLFGYHLKHPEEDIENYEETIKYIEKYFEAYELPLYTISTLLEEYNSGIEKAKKNDEFGINGEVTNYRNSWNKKVVRVKGKIQNIQKTYNDARDMYDNELLQWEITVSSDDFFGDGMHLYFDYSPKGSSRLGGTVTVEKDIIKLKKNDEIMFITEMFTNNSTEWISYFPVTVTELHFGYAEILEINGETL